MRAAKIPPLAGTYRQSHRDRGRDAPALFVRKVRDCAEHRKAQPHRGFQQKVLPVQRQASQDLMDRVVDLGSGWGKAVLAPEPRLAIPLVDQKRRGSAMG